MTISQKRAIYYRRREIEDDLRCAIMDCLDVGYEYAGSKYSYMSNFLKYVYGVSVNYRTIYCNSEHTYCILEQFLNAYTNEHFSIKYLGCDTVMCC